jgi:hypothetical protein
MMNKLPTDTTEIKARIVEAEQYGNREAATLARWQLAHVQSRKQAWRRS